jgi:hypothetical protein
MVKTRRRELSGAGKRTSGKPLKTALPLDTYEEWLKKQTVKPHSQKLEVQLPVNAYEAWIREQVLKRLAYIEA